MSILCHSETTFESGFEMQWLEEVNQKDAENKTRSTIGSLELHFGPLHGLKAQPQGKPQHLPKLGSSGCLDAVAAAEKTCVRKGQPRQP